MSIFYHNNTIDEIEKRLGKVNKLFMKCVNLCKRLYSFLTDRIPLFTEYIFSNEQIDLFLPNNAHEESVILRN